MSYEIVYVSLISSFFGILGLLLWQRGTFLRMDKEFKYNKDIMDLEHKYKLKVKRMNKKKPGIMGIIKDLGLKKDQIGQLLDLIPEGGFDESAIMDTITGFMQGLSKGKSGRESEEQVYEE